MDFQRPPGFKFVSKGTNLRSPADAIAPDKYTILKNSRSVSDTALQTRPGYSSLFDTADNHQVTDIGSYATLGTDGKPRFLARLSNDKIYLDNAALVATLSAGGAGACMLPFRPSASAQSWMYVTNGADYQKLSAPDAGNTVVAQKVGIAEPGSQIDAATNAPAFTTFNALAVGWTPGGTAGATSNTSLLADTVGAAVIADPVVATRKSAQVVVEYYTPGMLVTFAAVNTYPIEEVWKPCATTTISAIRYYSGVSGKCMVVPAVDLSDTLGRGSLVTLGTGGGAETVLVLSVLKGVNGTCAFECSTAGTHAAAEAVTGVLAIVVHGTVVAGDAITFPTVTSTIAAGTGTLSQTLTASTFRAYAQDDYIHVTLLLNNIAAVTTVSLIFNVGKAPADYVTSILTYTVTGPSLDPLLLAGEVVELHFPISALGGSLEFCNGIQLQLVTTGSCATAIGALWVGGGGLPDIGDTGIPYRYRVVPRSSSTGAKGNPNPDMRSNASPRRQSVLVKTSTLTFADGQVDLIDVERYGGSLTSFRYLGTAKVGADFTDNYFDDSLQTAALMETDNFEPWPSIDLPFAVAVGGGITVTVAGTWITVAGIGITWPTLILSWLPGTLVTLTGVGTFTLRARPTKISGTSYLFEIEECIGAPSPTEFSVLEPNIARQILPVIIGPDDNGTVFGLGDPLRPGTLYFAKAFNPDSAPDTFTVELSPPSEPLVGGEKLGAVTLVSSSDRWWAVYPSFLGTTPYTKLTRDVGRALASPLGICSDGQKIYFWAKDCIASTSGGGYEDLTSLDLYPLFPHDGIPGADIAMAGVTVFAPDYSRVATFRLAVANKVLYADYQDSTGTPRTLVLDLRTGGWSVDEYHDAVTVHYAVPQPSGSLTGPTLYPSCVMGDEGGKLWNQKDDANDNASGITMTVGTFEYDGGDDRMQPKWGDGYMDCVPACLVGLSVTPVSQGAAVVAAATIPQGSRTMAPISLAGGVVERSLGLLIVAADDFSTQAAPTQLFRWGLSAVSQPEIIGDRSSDWSGSLRG